MTQNDWRGVGLIGVVALLVLMEILIGIETLNSRWLEPALDRWVEKETETWPVI